MLAQSTITAHSSSGSGFSGADVDGLDRVAAECREGAQVCDEVRMVCEAIVAAASFFGPFGAAFIAYLKGVVIPWLTRISQALTLFARVLSAHSAAQRDASSSATSLPDYVTPDNLPAGNTSDYPTLPTSAGTDGFAVSIDTPSGHAELVYTPTGVTSSTNPFTGASATSTPAPTSPSAITDGGAALGTPITSGTGLSTQPVGTTAGSPNLLGSSGYGGGSGGYGGGSGTSFGGIGGGIGGTSTDLGGTGPDTTSAGAPASIGSANAALGGSCAATGTGSATAAAQPSRGVGASHDGLYSGLGQATGIGAGAAAIAKSALAQSRRAGADSLIGTVLLPADGGSDGAVQAQIFGGELG